MSNRKGNDLGLSLASLGYSAPTPASLGAGQGSVGAGLPTTLLGRTIGDHHYNTTDGRLYILTGAAAGSIIEPFSYTNASALVGQTSPNGGVWAAGGLYAAVGSGLGSPTINSVGQMVLADLTNQAARLVVGSFAQGGEAKVSAMSSLGNPAGNFHFEIGSSSTSYTKLYVRLLNNDPSSFGQAFGRAQIFYYDSAGNPVTIADNGSNATGFGLRTDRMIDVNIRLTPAGAISLYIDGVLRLTGSLTTAQLASLSTNVVLDGNAAICDNLTANATGTEGWTPSNPIYLYGFVPGVLAVANNVMKPGLRVPAATVLRQVIVRVDTVPAGSDLIVTLERFNGGVSQGVIATVTVTAGTTNGSVTGLAVALAAGDILKTNVTAVGSTTSGSDMLMSADCW